MKRERIKYVNGIRHQWYPYCEYWQPEGKRCKCAAIGYTMEESLQKEHDDYLALVERKRRREGK